MPPDRSEDVPAAAALSGAADGGRPREARTARSQEFLRTWTPVRGTGTAQRADIVAAIARMRTERDRQILEAGSVACGDRCPPRARRPRPDRP
ncbi:MAG: hypothetical protein QM619_15200 [Micropruina sp.]|uniref:hypothetical protein n=1 Tax=Micropruina sp. TaxID=2737536 RepID=UPI0039E2E98D